ncbi:ubiquitin recognition factor in ER-associated degradation protein 1-like [Paramacrobiotus metropolitanus]|uniref:ubiquitin recognition factor in ER-associated degradation protein 1-like n=1 Tax=Paramacrobiotus metropolitanus TaxID=2943436 RepID=UPI002446114F|nr:ubiquitin recognition factor in ER-associated degradation protein 1-like [Paramacrobiotus metropolitanus]XP_055338942.1 ubiquitin recognition factor in ER-associated degradation protein 1-like [Paramacrobiotus metropolitanus]
MFPFAEFFGGLGQPFPGGTFRREYRIYSAIMFPNGDRSDVEKGGKIIMPPSALEQLSRMNVQFPMLFKLQNGPANRATHCGVLEFVAEEGFVYAPSWMMRNLLLDEGDIVSVQSVSLPVATYSKFQPQSTDFLDITDPRAVLERALRGFACLTVGDVIAIEYNAKIFELLVQEARPASAVSIIECDMQVEFSAPVGYREPERIPRAAPQEDEPMMIDADALPSAQKFTAFTGSGQRLGGNKGNKKKAAQKEEPLPVEDPLTKKRIDVNTLAQKGIPNYDWKPGKLVFRRNLRKPTVSESDRAAANPFAAFSGPGFSLKKSSSKA